MDPRTPVVFDKDANEYLLRSTDGTVLFCMHFCIHCGGSLPEPPWTEHWSQPDPQEFRDLMARLEPARSWREAIKILGQPICESPVTQDSDQGKRRKVLEVHYGTVAKSFDLTVNAYDDGEWTYSLSSKGFNK